MRPHPLVAVFLSLLVPGLGQMYSRDGGRGAAILVAAIVIGSLTLLFVLVFLAADPEPGDVWAYWLPRIGRDVMAFWSVVFWVWAVVDAHRQASSARLQPDTGR